MSNNLENRKNRGKKRPAPAQERRRTDEEEILEYSASRRQESHQVEGFSADYRGLYGQEPPPAPDVPAEDDETEIDDFYPEADEDDGLLAKWSEEEPEEIPSVAEQPVRRRGKRRYGIAVGALVLLLALVGVGFIAGTIGNQIYKTVTDDSQLREYDTFLGPVVMQDPSPFESPQEADENFVLNASLWKTITANNGTNYSEYDDAGRALVPLGDVVESCRELFGPDCQLQPRTPVEETFFEYDSSANQFHVALYSSDSSYTPYTESIRKSGDKILLRVGYVSPSDEWRNQTTSDLERPSPTKYMEYELSLDTSTQKYYISAIRSLDGEE
ncbi:hypothetical protein [Clostridium sp. D33t1_170424_F3]|uniref:hypothetical protein n=1 Tax=Clostridium sp. D33t1_170424_F3 TaxID=2787099 RepID=UPI0018AC5D79|nr:hypothetical protein [Clostridium sp. D33t1_170424_F3]